uniref:Uncharacterized protein n=1 Tax=Rhizophora mucronata TaxID=61149 RepID=A0A2P2NB71_RHIMU
MLSMKNELKYSLDLYSTNQKQVL